MARRKGKDDLKPCPFCGGMAHIVVRDSEGNPHPDEYEFDPWSGLSFAVEHKNERCIIDTTGMFDGAFEFLYGSREEAAEAWNERYAKKTR